MQFANLEGDLYENITGGNDESVPENEPNECLAPLGGGEMKCLHGKILNGGGDGRRRGFHKPYQGGHKQRAGEWQCPRAG